MYNAYQKRGMLVVDVEIPPYTVENVDFFDLKPNYFRVQNMGKNRLYCGVSKTPTETDYDFFCKGESFSMYAEPHNAAYLYIYNPSGDTVKARVLGFATEFDPLALAFSQIEIDFAGMQLETVGAISEFKAPLPAGSNNIGSVNVAKLPALPAGSNVVGKFNVNNWPTDYAKAANQKDYTAAFAGLVEAVTLINTRWRKYAHCKSGNATAAGITYNSGAIICHIAFISNDGESDLTLTMTEEDGTVNSIAVKPGEVINHIDCALASIKIAGDNVPFRMIYNERNGG